MHDLLLGLEQRLLEAVVRHNPVELRRLLAADFIEFSSSGHIFDREAIIAVLGEEARVQFEIADFDARFLAPDVALATYRVARSRRGVSQVMQSLRSSIWRRTDGAWQMIFHQGTPILNAAPREISHTE